MNRTISINNSLWGVFIQHPFFTSPLLSFNFLVWVSVVKGLKCLIRDKGNISVLVRCVCAHVVNIVSTVLIQLLITLLPVSAENWIQCPRKCFLSPPSYIVNVTADDVPGYSVELSISS